MPPSLVREHNAGVFLGGSLCFPYAFRYPMLSRYLPSNSNNLDRRTFRLRSYKSSVTAIRASSQTHYRLGYSLSLMVH